MNRPILLIMAAGMGSRFGGPKQIEPIDEHDHVILDFSVFGKATGYSPSQVPVPTPKVMR